MTFASDRISANQETLAKQRYDMQSKERIARTSRFSFNPDLVMQHVRDRLIGQAEALEEIENMLVTIKADFNSPNRPLSVTLMLGPTGVGKTETVRLIAEAIHGKPDAFCRIDMNTLAQEHYAAALTGAPQVTWVPKKATPYLTKHKFKVVFQNQALYCLMKLKKRVLK